MYAGIAAGLLGAMILETVGGDLAGLTSVLCVTAGVWGAWVHRRLSAFSLVGNRRRERLIKRFTPMLAVGAFIGGVRDKRAWLEEIGRLLRRPGDR